MVVDKIYEWSKQNLNSSEPSKGVRCSSMGEDCSRKIWYEANNILPPDEVSGRIARLLNRGSLEEFRFIDALEGIGCIVYDQQKKLVALDGKLTGHIDGMVNIDGVPYLVEFKTHNEKSFNNLVKRGVEKSNFRHFVQMQLYMGLIPVEHGLYLAVNKNTDELYEEVIGFNHTFFEAQIAKAARIIDSESEPVRLYDDPDFYQCKLCRFRNLCHGIA